MNKWQNILVQIKCHFYQFVVQRHGKNSFCPISRGQKRKSNVKYFFFKNVKEESKKEMKEIFSLLVLFSFPYGLTSHNTKT